MPSFLIMNRQQRRKIKDIISLSRIEFSSYRHVNDCTFVFLVIKGVIRFRLDLWFRSLSLHLRNAWRSSDEHTWDNMQRVKRKEGKDRDGRRTRIGRHTTTLKGDLIVKYTHTRDCMRKYRVIYVAWIMVFMKITTTGSNLIFESRASATEDAILMKSLLKQQGSGRSNCMFNATHTTHSQITYVNITQQGNQQGIMVNYT